jgi:hypothetical protein
MKKIITATGIALAIAGGVFLATHHAVYGKCHQTPDGQVCTLLYYARN